MKQRKNAHTRSRKKRKMSRREMIRVTGLAALGLVYARPTIETLRAAPSVSSNHKDYGGSSSDSRDKHHSSS